MLKLLNKFFSKPYAPCMELHNQLGCYISIQHPSTGPIEGYNQFFYENNFLVISCLKSEHNVSKIISDVYSFDIINPNIEIIKGERKVYLPNRRYITLDSNSIFVYNKTKLKVFY